MLKKEILRKKSDFNRIYRKGRSIGEKYVVIFYLKNDLEYNRKAFLASKKVENSVQRNRAKRLMRESWAREESHLKEGYDIILIARNTIDGRGCDEVSRSVNRGFRRAKLLTGTEGDQK